MTKRIIYPTPDGGVAIIIPAPDCGLTIEQIAQKDVPAGVEYQIVDVADIPEDRTFRAAWEFSVEEAPVEEAPVEEEPVTDEVSE
jgi:hypothetical protein